MKTETRELLDWYRTRVGADGQYPIVALTKAIDYIERLWTVVPREQVQECLDDINQILFRGKNQ